MIILGSCISRDIFDENSKIKIEEYFARSSFISIVSNPIKCEKNKLKNKSEFRKRMVYNDLNKIFIKKLDEFSSEYILIDFIDERLKIATCNGSIITYSNEFKESEFTKNFKIIEKNFEVWKQSFKKTIEEILKNFQHEKILINKIYLSEKYINKNNEIDEFPKDEIINIREFNKCLNKIYSFIESEYLQVRIINNKEYYADSNHRWGLAAYHYRQEYYNDMYNTLCEIIKEDKRKQIQKLREKDLTEISKWIVRGKKEDIDKIDMLVKENIITVGAFKNINLEKLNSWWDDEEYSRTFFRLMNGLVMLQDLTIGYNITKDKLYLDKGIKIIKRWSVENKNIENKNHMAYHDETTALRLENILAFLISNLNEFTDEEIESLLEVASDTSELLSKEEFHSTNTKHGMLQDMALLKYSIITDGKISNKYENIAIERLKRYFDYVYTDEGISKEHSPTYHLMITNNLLKFLRIISIKNLNTEIIKELNCKIKKAEKFVLHITRPDGRMPNISDTESRLLKDIYPNLFTSNEYKFIKSLGQKGKAPSDKHVVFKKSGYAIFRDKWNENGSQVIFTAAYNGGYHKHSDDLSFILYDGEEIIVEAGANGYNYKEPLTKYAYSTMAHNNLTVINKSLPRHDGKMEKVYISNSYLCDEYSMVEGINERNEGIQHKRKLTYKNINKILEIEDHIISKEINKFALNIHFAENLKIKIESNNLVKIIKNNVEIGLVKIYSNTNHILTVLNGKKIGAYQGWKFPKMEKEIPIDNLGINFECKNAKIFTQVILYKNIEKDSTLELLKKEQIYCGEVFLKYIYEKNESKNMIVSFPALGPINKFAYNYYETLKEVDTNKLFILDDFGIQGSYLLGKNRGSEIENTVVSLINKISSSSEIYNSDVITIGSSKGGFEALYYAIKYKLGNVIVGGPQSKLKDFLIKQGKHLEVAKYIDEKYDESEYMNEMIFNIIENYNDKNTKVKIHVSKNDHHYENHVKDLIKHFELYGIKYELDLQEYKNHAGLKSYFPPYLLKSLMQIDKNIKVDLSKYKKNELFDFEVLQEKEKIKLKFFSSEKKAAFAVYVYKDGECVVKTKYSYEKEYNYILEKKSRYRFKIYFKESNGERLSKQTDLIKVD